MIRCEPRLKVATDCNSARDSGYVTGVQPDGTSISSRDESRNPQRGRRIGNVNLYVFKKGIDEVIIRQFSRVGLFIEWRLLANIKSAGLHIPSNNSISTRVVVAGQDVFNEQNATPHLAVLCPSEVEETVKNFFKMDLAQQLLALPPGTGGCALKPLVIPEDPHLTFSELDITIHCNGPRTAELPTFCGTSISLIDKSLGPHRGATRNSTFGGVVKVMFRDGNSKIYGMTTGHILQDLHDDRGQPSVNGLTVVHVDNNFIQSESPKRASEHDSLNNPKDNVTTTCLDIMNYRQTRSWVTFWIIAYCQESQQETEFRLMTGVCSTLSCPNPTLYLHLDKSTAIN